MSLVADSNGEIQGYFDIPAAVPSGIKLVEFDGSVTQAAATFIGRGTLKIEDLRVVYTSITRRVMQQDLDPLAQTFIVPLVDLETGYSRQVAAVDLWFVAVGTSNILVQIRETELGFPTRVVIAESLLTPADITLAAWTRFRFSPVALEPNREYCIVIMCNDAVAEVATGGIGEFDAAAQQWVTSQPYQVGVLLSSSNNRTWTAHQTKDLTFRLVTCDYKADLNEIYEGSPTKTIAFPDLEVVDADHMMVLAAVERPTAETDVVFHVTLAEAVGTPTYTVMEGQPFTLSETYTGTVEWEAVLTGTFSASPILHRDVHLIVGTRLTTGDYVTRAMLRYGGEDVKIYIDAYLPNPAVTTLTVYVEDGEDTWVELTADVDPPPRNLNAILGDGWVEYAYTYALLETTDTTRLKLVITGTAREQPIIKNIRMAILA
jgi:hypothetical protein